MSLQKTWTKPSTAEVFNDAFHRVDSILWNRNDVGVDCLKILVFTFKNQTDANTSNNLKISVRRYTMPNGFDLGETVKDNIHAIVYDWLKTHDDFSGASDV